MGFEQRVRETLRLHAEFLREIEAPFNRVARRVTRTSFVEARVEVGKLREDFVGIMRQHPESITDPAARRRAIDAFDRAYDIGRDSWRAEGFWRALHGDDEGRRILEKWRRRGVLRFDAKRLGRGRTPRLITVGQDGGREFRPMHIDHAVPRKRNPFRAFDASNLRLVGEKHNQWLNQLSRGVFPMAPGRSSDSIERYVMANNLARDHRQPGEEPRRPSRRRGRRRGASKAAKGIGILAILADLLGARSRAEAYAELARQARERAERRKTGQSRREIDRDEVDAFNVENKLDLVYDHHQPPLVDSRTQRELVAALRHWIETSYGTDGSGARRFERVFSAAKGEPATRPGGELSERNEQLGALMARHIDEHRYIEDALDVVEGLLRPDDLYRRRAEALERLADASASQLESELESYGVSIEDAGTLLRTRRALAASYRAYVDNLEDIQGLLRTALELNENRRSRIDRAIQNPPVAE